MTQLCDQPGCNEPATHTYTFDWGQSGVVCARHQITLQQTAASLDRHVVFAPINANATPPLQREERVKLKAESLVLAEEVAELKLRGLELYRQNSDLISQVQSLTVRLRESEAQRTEALDTAKRSDERQAKLEVENAELGAELGRLRVLVLPPAPPAPLFAPAEDGSA